MSKPIHPKDMDGPPFCLLQMHDCIESWRGTPRSRVPQEVKALAFMFDKLRDTMTRCEQMDRFVQAIEIEMKAEHLEAMRKIAAIRDQVCVVNVPLHAMEEAIKNDTALHSNAQGVRDTASLPNQKRAETVPAGNQTSPPRPHTRQGVRGAHQPVCSGGTREPG